MPIELNLLKSIFVFVCVCARARTRVVCTECKLCGCEHLCGSPFRRNEKKTINETKKAKENNERTSIDAADFNSSNNKIKAQSVK